MKFFYGLTIFILFMQTCYSGWLFEGQGHSYWSNVKKSAAKSDKEFEKRTGENDSSDLAEFYERNPEPSWTCKYYKLGTNLERGKCAD
jgi:hypothetical protein